MGFLQTVKGYVTGNSSNLPATQEIFDYQEKGWEQLESQTVLAVSNGNPGTLSPTVGVVQCLNKYRTWVYPCVRLISRHVSTAPGYLYKEIGQPNDEEFNRILKHPLLSLIKKPNKFMSGRLFWETIAMHLDLVGVAFARILRNGVGQPAELHIMNPHECVSIEFGATTNDVIKKFTFTSMQNRFLRLEIPWDDCLYFHYPHPNNPYASFSPIQALAHVTDLDLYMQVYEKTFFQNNAQPDFVILMEKGLPSREMADRMMEGWNARHRGPGRNHKPAILGPDVKIQELSMSAKDFEFLALANWTEKQILAAYNVSEVNLGQGAETNRAGQITAESTFIKNCINPRLDLIKDVINMQLLSQFKHAADLEFRYESVLPKDDEWELTQNEGELNVGLTTINEIRKRKGMKEFKSPLANVPMISGVPLGGEDKEADELYQKSQMGGAAGMAPGMPGQDPNAMPQPVSNAPEAQGAMGELGGRPEGKLLSSMLHESLRSSRPSLSMLLNAARGKRGGLRALVESHPEIGSFRALLDNDRYRQGLSKLLTRGIYDYIETQLDEGDKFVFKVYEDTIEKTDLLEEEYAKISQDFYTKKGIQLAEVVEKSFSDYVTKEPLYDLEEEDLKRDYKESVAELINKGVELGYKMGFSLVRKAKEDTREPDAFEPAAMEAAGKLLDKSADLKVKSTKKALTRIIKEGIENGWDSEMVANHIKAEFKDIGANRAELIARTELSAAISEGLLASYNQMNEDAGKLVVTKTILYVNPDERLCKECEDIRGDTVKDFKTGEQFIDLPVHPRCRCVPSPVMNK
jgi:HK97 family phage portal protein